LEADSENTFETKKELSKSIVPIIDSQEIYKKKKEFEEIKREVDTIINKLKLTKLSKILNIVSELEGIEFSWNN